MQFELLKVPLQPATLDKENRRVTVRFYSGADVPRVDWSNGREYMLRFSLDSKAAKLDRLNNGAPVLNSHLAGELSNQIGVVERAWLDAKGAYATLRFSDKPIASEIWRDIETGIIRNVSMGVLIDDMKDVTTKKDAKMRTLLATSWEPHELSMVPIGADPGATVMSGPRPNATRRGPTPRVLALMRLNAARRRAFEIKLSG